MPHLKLWWMRSKTFFHHIDPCQGVISALGLKRKVTVNLPVYHMASNNIQIFGKVINSTLRWHKFTIYKTPSNTLVYRFGFQAICYSDSNFNVWTIRNSLEEICFFFFWNSIRYVFFFLSIKISTCNLVRFCVQCFGTKLDSHISDNGLFDVSVVYLFVVVLIVLFLSSLSLSMSFQMILVCFRTCFARINLLIFRNDI
jgi:hypothetical protein